MKHLHMAALDIKEKLIATGILWIYPSPHVTHWNFIFVQIQLAFCQSITTTKQKCPQTPSECTDRNGRGTNVTCKGLLKKIRCFPPLLTRRRHQRHTPERPRMLCSLYIRCRCQREGRLSNPNKFMQLVLTKLEHGKWDNEKENLKKKSKHGRKFLSKNKKPGEESGEAKEENEKKRKE